MAQETKETARPRAWAIALHGGAGSYSRGLSDEEHARMKQSLARALEAGKNILAAGGSALDAVESVVVVLEDDPRFNAGRGAVFTRDGIHELDASIMDGATLRTGAVAGVTSLRNPVKAARLVMERSEHVLLVGDGADAFALSAGAEQVAQSYFFTEHRFAELQSALTKKGLAPVSAPAYPLPDRPAAPSAPSSDDGGGTVGCVALDLQGQLAAATSTGGMTAKLPGRVGDSPICGAGNVADARCAVSCTGKGEQFIRHSIAARIAWQMHGGAQGLDGAVRHCLDEILQPGDGGVIAVDRDGNIVMRATTAAMPRGAADSSGRFETAVWLDE